MDRRWLLGGLLIASGVGLAALATRRPKITAASRVLLIGDSLALGLTTPMKQLAEESGVSGFLGHGIVNTRIPDWASSDWLDQALADFQPTLILVSLGTNDEKTSPGAVGREEPAFHELLEKLQGSGAQVVWIGPPELPFERQGVSEMVRAFVPHYFDSEQLDIPRSPDGLHPNAAGYAGWAGAIWQWLT